MNERGVARDIVPGDTVKVFAHPAGLFNRTPPGGGGYGANVIGTVAVVTPVPLPGTTLPGLQIIMKDGRVFEAVDTAITVWRHREGKA